MAEMFFNVKIEFDVEEVDSIIRRTINNEGKGYLCAIESNNVTIANKDERFLKIVNDSLVNICDGSVLAKVLRIIYGRKFKSYRGDDLLNKYVRSDDFSHFFLGNTEEILDGLKNNLGKINNSILKMPFESLPFRKVEEFDYKSIADMINAARPDIIWVSLGAPKQEIFMSMLLPYLDFGIMCGVGAAFNFNAGVGPVRRAPRLMRSFHLEWLYRAYEEPKKNIPRYLRFLSIFPKLLIDEIRKSKRKSLKHRS
jgi:N-acetylglucosaminyldiphosphoundecaprenol N-acetyl-beta-D-mannosaminyltransferase